MTVIRALVSPERSAGADGTTGNDLTFSRFPPPSDVRNPNDQPIDQTLPCASVESGDDCDLFATGTGTDAEVSQFNMVFESSTFVRTYRLVKTQLTVPYGYVDYNANILGCDPNVNYYLCTQLLELATEIGPFCWTSQLPGACIISGIISAMAFFCVADTQTVGLTSLSADIFAYNNESYFGTGPYAPGLEAGLLGAGADPGLVADMTTFFMDFSARYASGDALQSGEFTNFNSIYSNVLNALLDDMCGLMSAVCNALPDPPDPNDELICSTCVASAREKKCGAWCHVCRTLYGLPDEYCLRGWDPSADNTVCGASDARVFFGDWIPQMNPAMYVSQPGGQAGTAPIDERSRATKQDDGTLQCRGTQNNILAKLIPGPDSQLNTDRNYATGACTACSIPIIGTHEGSSGTVSKNPDTIAQICPAGNYCDAGTKSPCPSTTNKDPFCYFPDALGPNQLGVGSAAQITARSGQRQWCVQEQATGTGASTNKCKSEQTRALCQNPSYGKSDGYYYGLWEEWATAFLCSVQPQGPYVELIKDTCPNLVCEKNLSGSVASQVLVTALGVAASCTLDENGSGIAAYGTWEGVGSPGLGVRPSPGGQTFNVARCSAGCESAPSQPPQRFKLEDPHFNTQTLKAFSQSVLLPDIQLTSLRQRASIWLGGPQCSVYEISPEAYGEMEIQITLIFPDGRRERITLDSASGPNYQTAIDPSDPDYVPFTARINRINVPDNAIGPDIVGLIVICGTSGADVFQNTPAGASCDLQPGFEGQIRGRVRSVNDTTATRYTNPWPKVVKQAIASRQAKSPLLKGEQQQCPMPIPYYLGELNCGLPAYWYFVPAEDAITYGPNCGQNGMQQITDVDSAALLCQQGGGSSCTPGFAPPLFGGIAAGRVARSACQELGASVRATGSSRTGGCQKNIQGPRNMPPGFTWRVDNTDTYDQSPDTGKEEYMVVPNMWVEGSTLFVLERFFQGLVKADVSVYIQADLGAETISVAPGQLQANATYCGAALNGGATGTIDGIVLNRSPFTSGSYTIVATCSSTVSNQLIEITNNPIVIPTLAPEATQAFSFAITAVGPLVLGDTRCEIVLSAGVGGTVMGQGIPEAGFLDRVVVSCDIFLPTLIYYAYQDFLLEPPPGASSCSSWSLLCILQDAPWYIRYMTYIVLGIIAIVVILMVGAGLWYAITRAKMLDTKQKLWRRFEKDSLSR